ncbi:hypothetical protein BHE74_00003559 [Ensete ventricosum]|nr:hypothetical protein BHE74_00003559 [Ensete ventricosum]
MPKRSARSPAPEQAASARPGKQVKVMVRKHKSHHGEGSSQGNTREKEPVAPSEEDSLPTYRRPKSMKDLYDMRVRKDDEGYYVLQIANSTPKDLDAMMRTRWGLRRMGQVSYKYGYWVALAHFQAWYPDLEVDNDPFTEKLKDNSVPMETRRIAYLSLARDEVPEVTCRGCTLLLWSLATALLYVSSRRLETNLGIAMVYRPLLDRSQGVGLACRGALASCGGARSISLGQAGELRTGFLARDTALQGQAEPTLCVPESRPSLYAAVGAPTEGEPPSASIGE